MHGHRGWLVAAGLLVIALSACTSDLARHNAAGNERFAEGEYGEALDRYRLAQVDAPDEPVPYYNAANAHNREGSLEETLAQTQQALKTAPPILAAQAWYNLGNAFFDAQEWAQAVSAYQESLRLAPDDADAKHNLELALRELEAQEAQQQETQERQDAQSEEGQEEEAQQEQVEQAEPESSPTEDASISEVEGSEEGETPQPLATPAEEGMTEEQAEQLLRALLADSQTLQERLRDQQPQPGPPPEQDW
jgi:Ca-activated chloride channel family protein